MINVRVGDIVRVQDIHHIEPNYYEVDRIEQNGVISQPACFKHRFEDITAVYRLTGKHFKCVWEAEENA